MSKRKIITIAIIYQVVLGLSATIIHEVSHYLAALAIGIPIKEIRFGFYGINPGVFLSEKHVDTNLGLFYFAGGLVPGLTLVVLYFLLWFRKYRKSPSVFVWVMGLVTIGMGVFQLAQGYVEGVFHDAYIVYADSLLSMTNLIVLGTVIAAIFFHLGLCPLVFGTDQEKKLR